ncbi:MAG: molecular chaperone DnaJ [Pseudanabaena frigida]|uniref:Molecular chaperone DnaJ n=1 Tax=Pseudanabaena frigida TaxID=945775 RepID=A0A2W4W339_9CYAN|nr:MAG: molecular chaperone DnaJ [Pseudanabaena frigida]
MSEKLEGDRLSSLPQKSKPCHHCEGKGYIELRDCSGEIQREENCSYCKGTGEIEIDISIKYT